jgi:tetratricopeptide (TPR) repeat protein
VQCIAPFQLYCLYGPGAVKVVDSATDPGFILSFAVLAAWLGGGLGLCRRRPLLFLSVAAFLGFSFITSNIPMVIGTVYGERLFYLPSLGVCLVPAILLGRLGATGRRVLLGAVVAWAVTCGAVILARNGAWRDTETLFLTDAARLPQSADLQAKAGYVLIDAEPERALPYFERSVAIDPEISGSWSSIGRIHQRRGDLDQAAANYKRALDTRFAATSGTESRTIEDYLMVLCAQQRLDEAVAFGREVLARMPEHYFARVAVLDHGSSRLPIGEWRRLLEDGMRLHGNDRVLILLAAMHGYESGQDLRQVLRGLQAGLAPPGPVILGPARQLRARLYLADVFGRLGQTAQALATYRDILGRAGLPTDLRQRIEASIRELTR